jgi:pyridoxamine 5'-phosphate oxidase
MNHSLHDQRREYDSPPLDETELRCNPVEQFQLWYQEAVTAKLVEPNAMVLSTIDERSRPAQRTVLLKYFGLDGFVFFTNYQSRKARHIELNHYVSVLFSWLGLHRQVEISGRAEKISTLESLKYFATRPRGSQLGAWVSAQSSVVTSRSLLESKLAEIKHKFSHGEVPWPSFWGGYRIIPERFEFWQGQPNRLHDRIEFVLNDDATWRRQRLAP